MATWPDRLAATIAPLYLERRSAPAASRLATTNRPRRGAIEADVARAAQGPGGQSNRDQVADDSGGKEHDDDGNGCQILTRRR